MLSKNQIKEIQALHTKKFRDMRNCFIAEGVKTVSEILENRPEIVKELFAKTDFLINHQAILRSRNNIVHEISDVELQKISLQNTPNTVLAVCDYFQEPSINYDFTTCFSFYLDDIRDPGNFGTIIRLADWFGIKKLFASPSSCDFYNPKVIQASMGAFLRVEVCYQVLPELLSSLQIQQVYGALLDGNNIYQQKLNSGLILIGNEANGISPDNRTFINRPITIPAGSTNGAESLNAAMAASIIASEFYRQTNFN